MKIPVLTYHSTNIDGNDYHNNDHVAFAQDLQTIRSAGINIISAHKLVEWLQGDLSLDASQKYVVLTFDDGCELDYLDWHHPAHGIQSSFYSLMQSYETDIHATSFVIASPQDRMILQDTCLAGHKIWGHHWWREVEHSGLISIENHSWDHVHMTLPRVQQKDNIKGDFKCIDTFSEADAQIGQATAFIESIISGKSVSLFAYPYGHYNRYLTEEYLPHRQNKISAAFSCDDSYVKPNSHLWNIPRFVCGLHWRNAPQLLDIVNGNYHNTDITS